MSKYKISKRRVLIRKIKNLFAPKPKKLSLAEMVEKINNENHFIRFDENIVNVIYTYLKNYGNVIINKNSNYEYTVILEIEDNTEKILKITESGLLFEK